MLYTVQYSIHVNIIYGNYLHRYRFKSVNGCKCYCLQDLKELKLTENKGYGRPKSEKGDSYIDTQDAKYICPVVGITMNGKHG